MPIIPLKQKAKIIKKGSSDGWGGNQKDIILELRCRFQEGIDREEEVRIGYKDLVLNGKFVFNKYPNITLEDTIEFADEHGREFSFQPRNIDVIRHINGKPLFTVVLV